MAFRPRGWSAAADRRRGGSCGFQVEGTAGTAGTLGAAYVGAQASKIIRIPIAAALTPLVARVLRYKKKNPAEATPERPRENAEG